MARKVYNWNKPPKSVRKSKDWRGYNAREEIIKKQRKADRERIKRGEDRLGLTKRKRV